MTLEKIAEINRTIAKRHGWKFVGDPEFDALIADMDIHIGNILAIAPGVEAKQKYGQGALGPFRPNSHVPNYYQDLNAVHEVEEVLTPTEKEFYGGVLYLGRRCPFQDDSTAQKIFHVLHKSAEERSMALVRVITQDEK